MMDGIYLGFVLHNSNDIMFKIVDINGIFTLPDTETDTDTDKLAQNPTGTCVGVCQCAV